MIRNSLMAGAAALGALVAMPASAHHSVAGVFDMANPITLEGTISKVDWINPHTYIHLDVTAADGTVTTWAMESIPPAMMRRAGITRQMIEGDVGEAVTIHGLPARDGTQALGYILTITYEDGHYYQLSTN